MRGGNPPRSSRLPGHRARTQGSRGRRGYHLGRSAGPRHAIRMQRARREIRGRMGPRRNNRLPQRLSRPLLDISSHSALDSSRAGGPRRIQRHLAKKARRRWRQIGLGRTRYRGGLSKRFSDRAHRRSRRDLRAFDHRRRRPLRAVAPHPQSQVRGSGIFPNRRRGAIEFYEAIAKQHDRWLHQRIMSEPRVGQHWSMAPLGYRVSAVARDRLLLVGDAAGYLSPITGQGNEFAMRTGRLAALAADVALRKGDLRAEAFSLYVEGRRREVERQVDYVRAQLRILRDPDALMRAARDDEYRAQVFGPYGIPATERGSLIS